MSIRGELAESNDRVCHHIKESFTWMTAAERVAMAAELRAARSIDLCAARKSALLAFTDAAMAIDASQTREARAHRVAVPGEPAMIDAA